MLTHNGLAFRGDTAGVNRPRRHRRLEDPAGLVRLNTDAPARTAASILIGATRTDVTPESNLMQNSKVLSILGLVCAVLIAGGMILHFYHIHLSGGSLGRLETSAGMLTAITLALALMIDQLE